MIATEQSSARFISVSDAAKHLGVSESMIRKLIKAGELKALRIGSSWRLCKENLTLWIERKMNEEMKENAGQHQPEPLPADPPAPKSRRKKKTS